MVVGGARWKRAYVHECFCVCIGRHVDMQGGCRSWVASDVIALECALLSKPTAA